MKHEGFSFFVFGAMIYHGVLNATCVSPYIDIVLTFFFFATPAFTLWSYFYGNLGFVTNSGVIVKLPSNKG